MSQQSWLLASTNLRSWIPISPPNAAPVIIEGMNSPDGTEIPNASTRQRKFSSRKSTSERSVKRGPRTPSSFCSNDGLHCLSLFLKAEALKVWPRMRISCEITPSRSPRNSVARSLYAGHSAPITRSPVARFHRASGQGQLPVSNVSSLLGPTHFPCKRLVSLWFVSRTHRHRPTSLFSHSKP